jgi:hypothetical protein
VENAGANTGERKLSKLISAGFNSGGFLVRALKLRFLTTTTNKKVPPDRQDFEFIANLFISIHASF